MFFRTYLRAKIRHVFVSIVQTARLSVMEQRYLRYISLTLAAVQIMRTRKISSFRKSKKIFSVFRSKMLFLRDLIRLSSQHRTLYCYLLLWILLIVVGMYKYVSSDGGINILPSKSFYMSEQYHQEQETKGRQSVEFHQQFCNDIEGLVPAEEGGLIEGWTLQGKTRDSIKSRTSLSRRLIFRSPFNDSSRRSSFTQSCS